MDLETARALAGEPGRAALEMAAGFGEPSSLGAARAMRREFPASLAAAATSQVELRRRAQRKLGERAGQLLWTPDGVEQATRYEVARWRAERLVASGVRRVVDLGCGIGSDALAMLDAGLSVDAVEIDSVTACLAAHNLPGAHVECADAEQAASRLLAGAGPETCVFLDPARRTAQGRSWRIADLTPRWEFLLGLLERPHALCAKLGPGLPPEILPTGQDAVWVSHAGDLVECGLWSLPGHSGRRSAVLLPAGTWAEAGPGAGELPVGPPGRCLHEPDPAVTRAGALAGIGPGLWRLDPKVAYLSSDEPVDSPLVHSFEVLEELDPGLKVLRRWVAEHRIGRLEIKKRAVDVDPALLRRRLRPAGPNAATLVLTPTVHGTRALVVRRLPRV